MKYLVCFLELGLNFGDSYSSELKSKQKIFDYIIFFSLYVFVKWGLSYLGFFTKENLSMASKTPDTCLSKCKKLVSIYARFDFPDKTFLPLSWTRSRAKKSLTKSYIMDDECWIALFQHSFKIFIYSIDSVIVSGCLSLRYFLFGC